LCTMAAESAPCCTRRGSGCAAGGGGVWTSGCAVGAAGMPRRVAGMPRRRENAGAACFTEPLAGWASVYDSAATSRRRSLSVSARPRSAPALAAQRMAEPKPRRRLAAAGSLMAPSRWCSALRVLERTSLVAAMPARPHVILRALPAIRVSSVQIVALQRVGAVGMTSCRAPGDCRRREPRLSFRD
jgi:hypothetical protein